MDKEKLIEAVKRFEGKKIAVIGDVAIDKYIYGKIDRINPENHGVHLVRINSEEIRLGCAANAAFNISTLGGNVSLGCVIGDDLNGVLFENVCKEKGIDLFHIKEGKTIVKERHIESEFNKYLLRADYGESELKKISDDSINKLFSYLNDNVIDVILLSDYNKTIFRGDLGNKLIEFAKSKNIPVIVDPKPSNIDSFRSATLLCPNLKEAREISKIKEGDERVVAEEFWKITNSKYVVVTCGKKGMVCYDGQNMIEISTKAREVADVSGAGDTVSAVIALGLASGLDFVESAQLANYAAGVVVEKPGTATVVKEELIKRISDDGNI